MFWSTIFTRYQNLLGLWPQIWKKTAAELTDHNIEILGIILSHILKLLSPIAYFLQVFEDRSDAFRRTIFAHYQNSTGC